MSLRTVRLEGGDAEVVAVAEAAREAIAADRALANRLIPAVMRLARDRRDLVAAPRGAYELLATSTARASLDGSSGRHAWPWILAVALLAVNASASMFLPPVRRVIVEIDIALPTVVVSTAMALVLLPIVGLLARRARSYPAYVGMVTSTIVAAVLAAIVVYRMIVGTASRGVPFSEEQLRLWFVASGILLIELIVLIRLFRRRRATGTEPGRPRRVVDRHRRADGDLRREAARLAALKPRTRADAAALERRWAAAIVALDLPAKTEAQARRLGPVPWFVWTHFDGDIDVGRGTHHGIRRHRHSDAERA